MVPPPCFFASRAVESFRGSGRRGRASASRASKARSEDMAYSGSPLALSSSPPRSVGRQAGSQASVPDSGSWAVWPFSGPHFPAAPLRLFGPNSATPSSASCRDQLGRSRWGAAAHGASDARRGRWPSLLFSSLSAILPVSYPTARFLAFRLPDLQDLGFTLESPRDADCCRLWAVDKNDASRGS